MTENAQSCVLVPFNFGHEQVKSVQAIVIGQLSAAAHMCQIVPIVLWIKRTSLQECCTMPLAATVCSKDGYNCFNNLVTDFLLNTILDLLINSIDLDQF